MGRVNLLGNILRLLHQCCKLANNNFRAQLCSWQVCTHIGYFLKGQ